MLEQKRNIVISLNKKLISFISIYKFLLLLIISSSLVGITYAFTLLSGVEICASVPQSMGCTYTAHLIGEEVFLCDDCYNEIYDDYYGWMY